MAKLPKSWGLKERKRSDGKLDIIGKDDAGHDYRVRTTDGPEVSDRDVAELHAADREAYSSRDAGARAFVGSLVNDASARERSREERFGEEMVEASGPVAFALLDRRGNSSPFSGSTQAFRRGWDRMMQGER
jgi:hypothetical protein